MKLSYNEAHCIAKAHRLAMQGLNLEAAWAIWDIRPRWAARLLCMACRTPSDSQDYWRECCAWDNIPDTPPAVVTALKACLDTARAKCRARYKHRCRKRDIKIAFGT